MVDDLFKSLGIDKGKSIDKQGFKIGAMMPL